MTIELNIDTTVWINGDEVTITHKTFTVDIFEQHDMGDHWQPSSTEYHWNVTPKPSHDEWDFINEAVEKYLEENPYEVPEPDYDNN